MTESKPRAFVALLRRFSWVWITPVFAMFALSAWAFASPIGASPDDDYHLASIWCANDARTDLCVQDPDRSEYHLVFEDILKAPCFVADMNESAGCQEWAKDPTPTYAADHGNWIGAYPPLYYAAMNVFASHNVQVSAIVMRLVSAALFVALVTALVVLLPAELKVPLVAGWIITIVPLGMFLIASNNPGSWALIGVGTSWLAALGWFRTLGRRSWVLGALTAFGVLIAAGARTDAAVYSILGLGIASFISFEKTKAFGLKLLLPVALVVTASLFFTTSGYADVATGGLDGGIPSDVGAARNPGSILAFNLISIPRLWTGVFGSWGLGWRMEIWPGFSMVEFATLAVFIGLASLGIRVMPARKAIMSVALIATLYILPVYILTVGGSVVGENVQPRYILSLVVVLGGLLLLTGKSNALAPSRWHIVPAMILLIIANTIALYTNLRRYLTGFDVEQLSLEKGMEWWWAGFPAGPTVLWIIGSLAFAVVVVLLGAEWLRIIRRAEASTEELQASL